MTSRPPSGENYFPTDDDDDDGGDSGAGLDGADVYRALVHVFAHRCHCHCLPLPLPPRQRAVRLFPSVLDENEDDGFLISVSQEIF